MEVFRFEQELRLESMAAFQNVKDSGIEEEYMV